MKKLQKEMGGKLNTKDTLLSSHFENNISIFGLLRAYLDLSFLEILCKLGRIPFVKT
jgi:hypothetical protein